MFKGIMTPKADKIFTVELPDGTQVSAPHGANLRRVLKSNFDFLYNGSARWIHCRGFGTCGTCSVFLSGEASSPTPIEKWRLNFHPHKNSLQKGLRLACQTQILGDLKISKWDGLWGNRGPGDSNR